MHSFWFLKKASEHYQFCSKCSPLFFDLNPSTCPCLTAICMLEHFKSRTGPKVPRYPVPKARVLVGHFCTNPSRDKT